MLHSTWRLLVVLGLVASSAFGQTAETGLLAGRVVDQAAVPVVGAVVTAARTDGSNLRSDVTDELGRFRLGFLPPGTYSLAVDAEGYAGGSLADLRVRAAATTEVEVRLAAANVTDVITVSGAVPLLDASTTERSTVLDADDIELLPSSRTATDLIAFTAGARPDQVWGGSTEQANAYQLDGVSVNHPGFGGDFLLPNVDWIEQVEVKGLGAGAEYGGFQGGLINIVTKSGGNELEGAVRTNFEDESLNSTTLDAFEVGAERDRRTEASFDLSGPIVRDRLYFFASAQQSRTDTNIVDGAASAAGGSVVFLPVQEERTETKIFTKLSLEPNARDRFAVVLGWDDVETDNRGLSSFTAPEAAQLQESPALLWSASWQRILGDAGFLELKATGFDAENNFLPLNGDRPAVQLLGGNRNLYGNAIFTREQSLESTALSASWDGVFDLGSTNHELKLGASHDLGTWLEQRRRNGGYTWRPTTRRNVAFDPNDVWTWNFISSDWGGDIRLDAETTNSAVWLQDEITLGARVTIAAGLRYGRWTGDLTPGFAGGSSFQAVDADAIAPRLGVIFDVRGNGSLVLKAHFGRYHQNLFALMFDRTEGGDAFQDLEFWDWIAAEDPNLGRTYTIAERPNFFELFDDQATGSDVGPVVDFDQPYVDQGVLSVETALGERSKLSMTYVNRKNEDVLALVDRNLDSNYTLLRNIRVIDFRTGNPILGADGEELVLPELWLSNDDILFVGGAPGLTSAQVAALGYDRDLVLTNVDEAERTMDQLQLEFQHRGDRFDLVASVVWTELEGNFFSVSGYDDPFGAGAGAFVRRNEQTNFGGNLENYAEWEAKLRWTGELPWGFRGGLYANYRRGDFTTPAYTIDGRNHDFVTADGVFLDPDLIFGITGERVLLEPRGSRRLEDSTVVDLSLDRPIALGASTLTVSLDVFNVLNEDAVTSIVESVNDQDPDDPTTLFGAPQRREAPRTVRLGLSLRF